MADIASGDVTYTVQYSGLDARGHKMVIATLAFGDSALTYPAGGIPISGAKLGLPNIVEALIPFSSANASVGYDFQFDRTAVKLQMLRAPAQSHNHDILLKNAAVADGATARVNAGANLLGANTGGDLTVTGGGANGGIVTKTLAASVMVEPSTVALAAQSIVVMAIGW